MRGGPGAHTGEQDGRGLSQDGFFRETPEADGRVGCILYGVRGEGTKDEDECMTPICLELAIGDYEKDALPPFDPILSSWKDLRDDAWAYYSDDARVSHYDESPFLIIWSPNDRKYLVHGASKAVERFDL